MSNLLILMRVVLKDDVIQLSKREAEVVKVESHSRQNLKSGPESDLREVLHVFGGHLLEDGEESTPERGSGDVVSVPVLSVGQPVFASTSNQFVFDDGKHLKHVIIKNGGVEDLEIKNVLKDFSVLVVKSQLELLVEAVWRKSVLLLLVGRAESMQSFLICPEHGSSQSVVDALKLRP